MKMSQNDFRDIFIDNTLGFLWRQWSAIGVLGEARAREPWAIDPEALLIFTLEIGRYDARLFDEVMDWLVTNGHWIDMQRLRGILRKSSEETCRLMGAVSEFLASQGKERKWSNLAKLCFKNIPEEREEIFKIRYAKKHISGIIGVPVDGIYLKYGFFRALLKPSGKSRQVIPTAESNIRFMLRGLFGVGSRAECILYLLTHEAGHPSEVAKAIGISIRGAQDALIELSKSGLVMTRIKGKRKIEYWLSQAQWWEFMSKGSIEEIKRPVWIDWIALFNALLKVWKTLLEIGETKSEYIKSSKLRDAMEIVGNEFAQSGIDIPPILGRNVRPENYAKAFEEFIIRVFGVEKVQD
ncbi:MAG: helix-turn-helix domain-containing protein [Thermodesulfovibrionales bacterium]|nr:helix-turn-helix domain-containing protein [Thermodesulfovibrionales bacterium]